eukprot:gene25312-biopygen17999
MVSLARPKDPKLQFWWAPPGAVHHALCHRRGVDASTEALESIHLEGSGPPKRKRVACVYSLPFCICTSARVVATAVPTVSPYLPGSPSQSPATILCTLRISGMCSQKAARNGVYTEVGIARSGRPWFQGETVEDASGTCPFLQILSCGPRPRHVRCSFSRHDRGTIYFDPSCDGSTSTARWIMTAQTIDPSKVNDLDGDGQCRYSATFFSDGQLPPLGQQSWGAFCVSPDTRTNVDVTVEYACSAATSAPTTQRTN